MGKDPHVEFQLCALHALSACCTKLMMPDASPESTTPATALYTVPSMRNPKMTGVIGLSGKQYCTDSSTRSACCSRATREEAASSSSSAAMLIVESKSA